MDEAVKPYIRNILQIIIKSHLYFFFIFYTTNGETNVKKKLSGDGKKPFSTKWFFPSFYPSCSCTFSLIKQYIFSSFVTSSDVVYSRTRIPIKILVLRQFSCSFHHVACVSIRFFFWLQGDRFHIKINPTFFRLLIFVNFIS